MRLWRPSERASGGCAASASTLCICTGRAGGLTSGRSWKAWSGPADSGISATSARATFPSRTSCLPRKSPAWTPTRSATAFCGATPKRKVHPYCREHGIGTVCYGALAQGLLAGKIRDPAKLRPEDPRLKTVYYDADVFPRVQGGDRGAVLPRFSRRSVPRRRFARVGSQSAGDSREPSRREVSRANCRLLARRRRRFQGAGRKAPPLDGQIGRRLRVRHAGDSRRRKYFPREPLRRNRIDECKNEQESIARCLFENRTI